MPRERLSWVPVGAWAALNARLRRFFELTDGSSRWTPVRVSASTTLDLSWPVTLIIADTTAGDVTVTVPNAAAHVGYRVEVKKIVAANSVTIAPLAGETIDGGSGATWSTQWQSAAVVSDGVAWFFV